MIVSNKKNHLSPQYLLKMYNLLHSNHTAIWLFGKWKIEELQAVPKTTHKNVIILPGNFVHI